jgi:AraC-like DNA-binding protein
MAARNASARPPDLWQPIDLAPVSLSTDDLPERDRLPFWCDVFGRIVNVGVKLQSELPLRAKATLLVWPELRVMWTSVLTPADTHRTSKMAADGDDSIGLLVNRGGRLAMRQRANAATLAVGDAVAILHAEPCRMTTSQADYAGFSVPRAALAPFIRDIERSAMRVISRENEALRLLVKYTSILQERPGQITPELRHLAATHIQDLVAMALGANGEGAAIAEARGVRAARLRAIKADILENLGSSDLTVSAVALRQRVTPRYIHMLFESEGVTFSEFVCRERLTRAHHMLLDPRSGHLSIAAIAFATGFGDLSCFNRSFRRRFGTTPSEIRCGNGCSTREEGR